MKNCDLIRWSVVFALALGWLTGTPARADDAEGCAKVEHVDAVAACTRLIDAGKLQGRALAVVHNRRCAAYNHKGDPDSGLPDCDRALEIDPNYLVPLANRCWTYLNKNDLDRASADCEEAIRRDPNLAQGFHLRANIWERMGDNDRALADFSEAIRISPKYAFAHRGRCIILIQRAELDRALTDCNEAVRINPNSASFLNTRCWLMNKRGELEKAFADCNKAISLNPKFANSYISRCETWLLKKDAERAIADCNQAIQLNPKLTGAFNNRCWAYTVKREPDAAIADCNESLRLNPKGHFPYNNRGNAWRNKGDMERAIADYSEAIRLNPKFHQPLVNRGMLLEAQGKLDRALADFRAVLALRPGNTVTAERIQRLERKIRETVPTIRAGGTETRIALLIGNAGYKKVAPLTNAKRDTKVLGEALRRIGFTVVTTQEDLSREQLIAVLRDFARKAESADWAVVYYAGHGLEIGGINYLIPVDAKLGSDRDVPLEAVELENALLAVEGARKLRLVILDACRDNPFSQTMKRSVASRSVGRGLAGVEPDGATLVAFAAKAGQVALDGSGANSPFATAIAKYIDTPGLEVNFLFRKVRDEVFSTTERQQEPFTYGSLPAEAFYFRNK